MDSGGAGLANSQDLRLTSPGESPRCHKPLVIFIPLDPVVPADVAVGAPAGLGGFDEVRNHLAGHPPDPVCLDAAAEGCRGHRDPAFHVSRL